jgi:predicted dehydrogenase
MALGRRGARVDDDSFISIGFANGVRAHLSMSKVVAQPQARFHLVGSDGTLTSFALDPQEGQLAAGLDPSEAGFGIDPANSDLRLVTRDGSTTISKQPGAYQRYYEAVRDAIRTGQPAPVNPADAVYCLRILEAARRSSLERTVIALPATRI